MSEESKNVDFIQHSPLSSIDKAIALTPLMQLCRIDENIDSNISQFKKEYERVSELLRDGDVLTKRTQARLYYMVSTLLLLSNGENKTISPTEIIESVVKHAKTITTDSIDFNAAIPMENGLWAIECASMVITVIAKNEFMIKNKTPIMNAINEQLNKTTTLLTDLDESNTLRTKNSLSRSISTFMLEVLSVNPKNSAELEECFNTFRNLVSLMLEMVNSIKDVNK